MKLGVIDAFELLIYTEFKDGRIRFYKYNLDIKAAEKTSVGEITLNLELNIPPELTEKLDTLNHNMELYSTIALQIGDKAIKIKG